MKRRKRKMGARRSSIGIIGGRRRESWERLRREETRERMRT